MILASDTRLCESSILGEGFVIPLAAGTREPEVDSLDLNRNTEGHLELSFGVHQCLGRSLARLSRASPCLRWSAGSRA